MDPSQMLYALLRWTSDKDKLSIEHMKVIVNPNKAYNDFLPGDECTAKFGPPNKSSLYPVTIVAVGHSKNSLGETFRRALEERNKEDDLEDPTACLENNENDDPGSSSVTASNTLKTKRKSTGKAQSKTREKKKKSINDIATDMAVAAILQSREENSPNSGTPVSTSNIPQDVSQLTSTEQKVTQSSGSPYPPLQVTRSCVLTSPPLQVTESPGSTFPLLQVTQSSGSTYSPLQVTQSSGSTHSTLQATQSSRSTCSSLQVTQSSGSTFPSQQITQTSGSTLSPLQVTQSSGSTFPLMQVTQSSGSTFPSLQVTQSSDSTFPPLQVTESSGSTFPSLQVTDSSGSIYPLLQVTQSSGSTYSTRQVNQSSGSMHSPLQVTQSSGSMYSPLQVTQSSGSMYSPLQVTQSSGSMYSPLQVTQSSNSLTSLLCDPDPYNGRDYWGPPVRPKATYPYNEESSYHLNGAFSALYQSPSGTSNKCHSCCDRVGALERQVAAIQDSMDRLIKKKKNKESDGAQSLDGQSQLGQQTASSSSSSHPTKADCTKETLVADIKDMAANDAINHIMVCLFTTEELIECSVMGVQNGRSASSQGLDPVKRTLLESIIKEKFGMTTTSIRAVMRNRKKIIKMRNF